LAVGVKEVAHVEMLHEIVPHSGIGPNLDAGVEGHGEKGGAVPGGLAINSFLGKCWMRSIGRFAAINGENEDSRFADVSIISKPAIQSGMNQNIRVARVAYV
jgi:hypothetical protein